MNFPEPRSVSKTARLTKWYSHPFRSCVLGFLVVSVSKTRQWRKRCCPFHVFVHVHIWTGTFNGLTWHRYSKLFRFLGQKSASQVVESAVSRTNQSNGSFPIRRLVIERHLLVCQDVVMVWEERLLCFNFFFAQMWLKHWCHISSGIFGILTRFSFFPQAFRLFYKWALFSVNTRRQQCACFLLDICWFLLSSSLIWPLTQSPDQLLCERKLCQVQLTDLTAVWSGH